MLQTRDKFLDVVETMVQDGYVAFVFLGGRRGDLVVVLLARYIVLAVGCNAENVRVKLLPFVKYSQREEKKERETRKRRREEGDGRNNVRTIVSVKGGHLFPDVNPVQGWFRRR